MTKEIFLKIIEAAQTTPTGDNCQPFYFKIDETQNTLSILHDAKTAKHALNKNNFASAISLGMMCRIIEIAAENYGYKIQNLSVQKNHFSSMAEPVAVIKFNTDSSQIESKHPLFAAIFERQTNRNPFLKLNNTQIDKLTSDFSNHKNMRIATTTTAELLQELVRNDQAFWMNTQAQSDVFSWVHFSYKSYEKERTGFYWKELGINPPDIPFIFMLKYCTQFAILQIKLGLKYILKMVFKNLIKNSSYVLITSATELNSHFAFIQLGRSAIDFWLIATAQGLAVQPITSMTLPYIYEGKNVHEVHPHLCQSFGLTKQEHPGWLFRIGNKSKGYSQKSLRKTNDQTLVK